MYDFGQAREVSGPEGIVAKSGYWQLPFTYRKAIGDYALSLVVRKLAEGGL